MITLFKKSVKNKKQILLKCVLCFHKHTFSTADVIRITETNPFFEPAVIDNSDDPLPFADEKVKLVKMNATQSEIVLDKGIKMLDSTQTEHIQFLYPAHRDAPLVIDCVFAAEKVDMLTGPWIKSLLSNEQFIVGYCADNEDIFLQSCSDIHIYESRGVKPAKTIKNDFGDVEVDITQNPGRRKLVQKMWLMSCWKMWFGKDFLKLVSSDKILSFPEASAIRKLDGTVIEVELYPDPFDAGSSKNRTIQSNFRKWINMDQLERDLK